MLTSRRASKFIRRFSGPGDDSGIVCFKFWQLVPAGGCPYQCSYCFLQTTPWFRFNPDQLHGLVYTNVDDMLREIDAWLQDPIPKMMIVGELQDGLVFETAFKKATGKPLTHLVQDLRKAGKLEIEGLKPRERTPKRGHILVSPGSDGSDKRPR